MKNGYNMISGTNMREYKYTSTAYGILKKHGRIKKRVFLRMLTGMNEVNESILSNLTYHIPELFEYDNGNLGFYDFRNDNL